MCPPSWWVCTGTSSTWCGSSFSRSSISCLSPTSKSMASKAPFETHHHVVPISAYVKVILSLLVAMVITVYVGYRPVQSDLGPISATLINQTIALVIAIFKASLVVLFFMGVKWSTPLTKLWAVLGFCWLSFFTIMWGDYGTRHWEQVQGWDPKAESALPR